MRTYASMTTAYKAWSIRRRGANTDGKNEPARSLGIDSDMSPAFVVNTRGRDPFRSVP